MAGWRIQRPMAAECSCSTVCMMKSVKQGDTTTVLPRPSEALGNQVARYVFVGSEKHSGT